MSSSCFSAADFELTAISHETSSSAAHPAPIRIRLHFFNVTLPLLQKDRD
jgi:hypothetical protein